MREYAQERDVFKCIKRHCKTNGQNMFVTCFGSHYMVVQLNFLVLWDHVLCLFTFENLSSAYARVGVNGLALFIAIDEQPQYYIGCYIHKQAMFHKDFLFFSNSLCQRYFILLPKLIHEPLLQTHFIVDVAQSITLKS